MKEDLAPALRDTGTPQGERSRDNSEYRAIVRRPGYGRRGQPVKVRTNHLPVKAIPEMTIYHYDIAIKQLPTGPKGGHEPKDAPPAVNRQVWSMLERDPDAPIIGEALMVYDGSKNVFSTTLLKLADDRVEFHVKLPKANRPEEFDEFVVLMHKVEREIHTGILDDFLAGRVPDPTGNQMNQILTAITVLNICIRHEPTFHYPSNPGAFFTRQQWTGLQGGIEMWRGYFQSIRPTPGRLLVNVDISAGAFISPGSLVDLCCKFISLHRGRHVQAHDLERLHDREHIMLDKFIRTIRFYTNYQQGVKSYKKIKRLCREDANTCRFTPAQGGNSVTVAAYFNQILNRHLNYPRLPLIEVGRAKIPMELAYVEEGQKYNRKLSPEQTAQALRFTTMRPNDREKAIGASLQQLMYQGNRRMERFGLKVGSQLVDIDARILPPPKLMFAHNRAVLPSNGAWRIDDCRMWRAASCKSWAVLYFEGSRGRLHEQNIESFLHEFVGACHDLGMSFAGRGPPPIVRADQRDVHGSLVRAGKAAKEEFGTYPEVIIVVLPSKGQDLYAEVKTIAETKVGVVTQCVQADKVRRPNRQYSQNVALKVNVKLGGINSTLDLDSIKFIASKPTMVFGLDVSHPSPGPGADTGPSVSGVVASMDRHASTYHAVVRLQAGRTEMIAELADMVAELLSQFHSLWNRWPERIMIFRDGASEGQFAEILRTEVPAFRKAFQLVKDPPKQLPTMTYVVAAKRHHVRFFPTEGCLTDKSGNVPPGTCVDREVCHPTEFDWYLCSHAGLLGTSRPTHYSVILDENKFDADDLEVLCYNLAHSYCRSTRTVSTNPACYYAHLVCARARHYLSFQGGFSDDSATELSHGTGRNSQSWRQEKQERLHEMQQSFRNVSPAVKEKMYFV